MQTLLLLVGWCILFVLCWPLALLALIAWPIVWLLSIPLALIGIGVGAVFALIKALLFLPPACSGTADDFSLTQHRGVVAWQFAFPLAERVTLIFNQRLFPTVGLGVRATFLVRKGIHYNTPIGIQTSPSAQQIKFTNDDLDQQHVFAVRQRRPTLPSAAMPSSLISARPWNLQLVMFQEPSACRWTALSTSTRVCCQTKRSGGGVARRGRGPVKPFSTLRSKAVNTKNGISAHSVSQQYQKAVV